MPEEHKPEEREKAAVSSAVEAAADLEDLQSVKEEERSAKHLEDAAGDLTLYPVEIVSAGVVEIESSSGSDSDSVNRHRPTATVPSFSQEQMHDMVNLSFLGQPIADASVEQLVQQAHGRAPQLTETAILKRVAFEAQTYLMATLRQAARRPTLAQLLQCDKAAFARLGSQVTNVRQRDDATYPLGEARLALRQDPNIALYLMPVAKSSSSTSTATASGAAPYSTARTHPYAGGRPKGGGKGKKGGGKSAPPVPAELRGKWHKNSSGEPICYGYNCKSGCAEKGVKPGGRCSKGLHICAEPRCGGHHSLQEHGSK
eukprot:s4_g50.t1